MPGSLRHPLHYRSSFQAQRQDLIKWPGQCNAVMQILQSLQSVSALAERGGGIPIPGLDTMLGSIYTVKLQSKEHRSEGLPQQLIPPEKSPVHF